MAPLTDKLPYMSLIVLNAGHVAHQLNLITYLTPYGRVYYVHGFKRYGIPLINYLLKYTKKLMSMFRKIFK